MELKSFINLPYDEEFFYAGVSTCYDQPRKESLINIIDLFSRSGIGMVFTYQNFDYPYVGGHSFALTKKYHERKENPSQIFPADKLKYGVFNGNDVCRYEIVILGERPSREEVKEGLNFVGDFGRVLYDILKEFGFNKFEETYVVNLSRIDGPEKHIPYLCQAFLPLLLYELAWIRPKVILCIGTRALRVFTRKSLNEVIETPIDVEIEQMCYKDVIKWQTKIFAMPLSILRKNSDLMRAREALSRFVAYINGQSVSKQVPLPHIKVLKTHQDVEDFVNSLIQAADKEFQIVSCDLEWQGRAPCVEGAFLRLIGFYWNCVAYIIYVSDALGCAILNYEILAQQIDRIFEHKNIQIVGHYFIADAAWFCSIGCKNVLKRFLIDENTNSPDFPGIFDTLNAHHAHDETGEFGLKESARVFLGYDRWDKELQNFIKESDEEGFGRVPDQILIPYLARDLVVTRELRDYHAQKLNADAFGNNCWRPFVISTRALAAYVEMSYEGVKVDYHRLYELQEVYKRKMVELENEMKSYLKFDFNPRSNQQKVVVLFGEEYLSPVYRKSFANQNYPCLRLTPFKSTEGEEWIPELIGRATPSTDLESLRFLRYKNPDNLFIKLLYEYQLVSQLVKTVLGPNGLAKFICKTHHHIHPMYFPYLETRRASSSKPNMQNLPAEEKEAIYKEILGKDYKYPIRSVLVPRLTDVFVSVDYVAAELLMLGILANEENLISDYKRAILPDGDPNKLDIHSLIATLAFRLNCPPTKKELVKAGYEHLRLAAKRIIFGLNYGRSAESVHQQLISSGMKITLEEVNKIIETIYERYPRVRIFQEEIRKRVRTTRWIVNCFGSYRRFMISRSGSALAENEREALNFTCQSGVADAISIALANFMSHPKKEELKYKVVMQHHDALTFTIPEKHVLDFQPVIRECMVDGVVLRKIDLDGNPLPIENNEYHFEVSIEAGFN